MAKTPINSTKRRMSSSIETRYFLFFMIYFYLLDSLADKYLLKMLSDTKFDFKVKVNIF
jgi:hypothetical protein